ncbi:hypothetical protein LZ31DRAFT_548768 [Colletotrichum somersetense]|nr:hypothetical protein LZ31DRAFT_548768 [Colletotrichum somersetense]
MPQRNQPPPASHWSLHLDKPARPSMPNPTIENHFAPKAHVRETHQTVNRPPVFPSKPFLG